MAYTGILTPEHLDLIDRIQSDWMTAALSTERADRPAVEAAVRDVYATIDLPAPAVTWMDSPLGGVYAETVVNQLRDQLGDQLWDQLWGQLGGQLRGQLGDQLWGQLGDQLWDQLRDQLRDQLGDQLGDQLWDQLWGQLGDQLGDQLWDQLGDQLWGQLGDQLGDQLRGQLWVQLRGQLGDQLWGQLGDQLWDQLRDQLRDQLGDQLRGHLYKSLSPWRDAYWMAWYTAGLRIAGLPDSPRLDALTRLTASVGWWLPMRDLVILTDRPTVIARDAQARLHSTTGPALAYADGYTLHAVGGVRVPADIVEDPDSITVDAIWAEGNAEVRRVMIDQRGWDWFVTQASLSEVAAAPDPANPGHDLCLYDLPEQVYGEPVRVVLVTNASPERDGTRRRFGLTVPATITDPVEAIAWTFDVPADQYAALARAT